MTGSVVWFDLDSGYGFIRPDDGGDDCFVHWKQIQVPAKGFKSLQQNQRVKFDVEQASKGPAAVNVRPL